VSGVDPRERGASLEESEPPLLQRLGPIAAIKTALERQEWVELERLLRPGWLWAFDHPVTAAEAVAALRHLLCRAEDVKLLPTALRRRDRHGLESRISATCCLMWGEPSWTEREALFDLHFGYAAGTQGPTLTYLAVTRATTQDVPLLEEKQ
jgi:hypothetical protein